MSDSTPSKTVAVWTAGTISGALISRNAKNGATILFTLRPYSSKHDYWIRLENQLAKVAVDNALDTGSAIMVKGELRRVKSNVNGKTQYSWQVIADRLALDLTDPEEYANESNT